VKDRLHTSGLGLSGGQQQRLCIARAIAIKPDIILMDEPASALDPLATARIEELILELKKEFTIVIVTHNMQQAARISDFTAFFYLGSWSSLAPPAKYLRTRPTNRLRTMLLGVLDKYNANLLRKRALRSERETSHHGQSCRDCRKECHRGAHPSGL